jgi:hypothetical protein
MQHRGFELSRDVSHRPRSSKSQRYHRKLNRNQKTRKHTSRAGLEPGLRNGPKLGKLDGKGSGKINLGTAMAGSGICPVKPPHPVHIRNQ